MEGLTRGNVESLPSWGRPPYESSEGCGRLLLSPTSFLLLFSQASKIVVLARPALRSLVCAVNVSESREMHYMRQNVILVFVVFH